MMLTLRHPDWTTDQILDELADLDFDTPTRFYVSHVKLTFKANLKFLRREGYVIGRPTGRLHPDLKPKKKRRRPDPPDLPYHHYYGGKDD